MTYPETLHAVAFAANIILVWQHQQKQHAHALTAATHATSKVVLHFAKTTRKWFFGRHTLL